MFRRFMLPAALAATLLILVTPAVQAEGLMCTDSIQSEASRTAPDLELSSLQRQAADAINTARALEMDVPLDVIQKEFDSGCAHAQASRAAYTAGDLLKADQELQSARDNLAQAWAQSIKVRLVETRAVWFDRGTIVMARNAAGMAYMIKTLKKAGFNTIFFECNNAGTAMWNADPSLLSKNPDIAPDWDPLACAVSEVHKQGMEIHAWVWAYNVGRRPVNDVTGRKLDYPGKVLLQHGLDWALDLKDGKLDPDGADEAWLDPSSPEVREFIKDVVLDIVKHYDVDGVQMDYIRYPFHDLGININSLDRFAKDPINTKQGRKYKFDLGLWTIWKTQQVSILVEQLATALHKVKPNCHLSAAVFPYVRSLRIAGIQQDWETWVDKGWMDTLEPMIYVPTAAEFGAATSCVNNAAGDRALVFGGMGVGKVDQAGMIEQYQASRDAGTLGITLFAYAQLNDKLLETLQKGPFRQPAITPQGRPIEAARLLYGRFADNVRKLLPIRQASKLQASLKAMSVGLDPYQYELFCALLAAPPTDAEIDGIGTELSKLGDQASVADIETTNKQVARLRAKTKNWLDVNPGAKTQRTLDTIGYLDQLESVLTYAAKRALSSEQAGMSTQP